MVSTSRATLAALGLGICAVLLVVSSHHRVVLEEINEDVGTLPEGETVERPAETTEMIYAQQHPVYTRCAKKVDMPEFVNLITKTCGNIHELSTLAPPCHNMLETHAKEFGCCWESVMNAYKQLDPQAHHSWRMWQGTVSGKAGISFDDKSCGDAMGEKGYEDLKKEVDQLKSIVMDQAEQMTALDDTLLYQGELAQKKGTQPLSSVRHAPFSGGDSMRVHRAIMVQTLRQKHAMHRDAMKDYSSGHAKLHESFFVQNPKNDEGERKMEQAGIKV